MSKVFFEHATIGTQKFCLSLHTVGSRKAHLFFFRDEDALETAFEICAVLDSNDFIIETGTTAKIPCLFLIEDDSDDALIFTFDKDRDLTTACEMADCFLELAADDDDETVAE